MSVRFDANLANYLSRTSGGVQSTGDMTICLRFNQSVSAVGNQVLFQCTYVYSGITFEETTVRINPGAINPLIYREAKATGGGLDVTDAFTSQFAKGQWYSLCARRASGQMSLFLNGVLLDGGAFDPTGRGAITAMSIGQSWSAAFGSFLPFNGDIADLQLWNSALTDAQVLAQAKRRSPVVGGSVGYYPIYPDGNRNVDYSGLGLNFTVNGTLANGSSVPVSWGVEAARPFFPVGGIVSADATGTSVSLGTADSLVDMPASAVGDSTSDGTATASLDVASATAAGDATSDGTAKSGVDYAGTGAGDAVSVGTADANRDQAAAATGAAVSAGTASAIQAFGAAATGTATSTGTAAGLVAFAGTAAGTSTSTGTADATLGSELTATGTAVSAGTAVATYAAGGVATGASESTGTATASLTVAAAASSSATTEGTATATAAFGATATGTSASVGTANVAIQAAAVGTSVSTGTASASVSTTADSSSTSTGTASATVVFAAAAAGASVSLGTAVASVPIAATAAGMSTSTGIAVASVTTASVSVVGREALRLYTTQQAIRVFAPSPLRMHSTCRAPTVIMDYPVVQYSYDFFVNDGDPLVNDSIPLYTLVPP